MNVSGVGSWWKKVYERVPVFDKVDLSDQHAGASIPFVTPRPPTQMSRRETAACTGTHQMPALKVISARLLRRCSRVACGGAPRHRRGVAAASTFPGGVAAAAPAPARSSFGRVRGIASSSPRLFSMVSVCVSGSI